MDDNDDDDDGASPPPSNTVYVLVFAHPDDESMFFVPTLTWLVLQGAEVWFLCLTTGDYDGLGTIREKELERAGRLLGAAKVMVRNDDEGQPGAIRDHPKRRYDKTVVASAIRESLAKEHGNKSHRRFVLITFDETGVSGHVNHTDVHRGVVHLMQDQATAAPTKDSLAFAEAWYLESEANLLVKYVPLVSWILLLASCLVSGLATYSKSTIEASDGQSQHSTRVIVRMHHPARNWAAMKAHASQFVWYRRLFVVFSCYTYRNKLTVVRRRTKRGGRPTTTLPRRYHD